MKSIYSAGYGLCIMNSERPPTIDPIAAKRWQQLSQSESPWLHEEVARRMQERLDWIKSQPTSWVHWEPERGGMAVQALLQQRYPDAQCYLAHALEGQAQAAIKKIVKPWWHPSRWGRAARRADALPEGGVQMLWANMALHMAADPQSLITRWHRALAVDGFLMFSCLGPDTLRQLRALYRALGWPAPAHEFTDMHDWGDMLVQAGFAEPVMDMERIELTFATPERLLQELRELGRNLHLARFPGLRGRAWRERLYQALARELADPTEGGRLKLTFEIVYGHAFKPQPRIGMASNTVVPLEEMRQVLRGRKSRQADL
jgi:malonyl-CoA O-methyltransferase